MPKLISKCGDLLFADRVSAMPGPGSLVLLLGVQVSLIGVLQRLSGTFVSGQVIFFSVVLGAAAMGMGSQIMVLGRYLL